MELCPNDYDKSSDFLAAKLYYKMLSYKFNNLDVEDDFDNNSNTKIINKKSKFEDDSYEE
jgi:agmatinase